MLTLETVKDILKAVKYPGLGRDIVSFGMVKNAVQCGETWQVMIEAPTQDQAVLDAIKQESLKVLGQVEKSVVWDVEVKSKAETKSPQGAPQAKIDLRGVKAVIAVASGKGGVGKSTVATNVALALSQGGASVGLMDADVYGPSLPMMYGLQGHPEMNEDQRLIPLDFHGIKVMSLGFLTTPDTPVIWRGPIVSKMIQQFLGGVAWGTLDYLIIDLPPGTGDVQLTLVQSAPLTGAIVVTTPQEVALSIAMKGLKMFYEVNVPVLGVVENMSGFVCSHCGTETHIFKHGGGERMAKLAGGPLLGRIPLDPVVAECGDAGLPVILKAPDSPAAQAYRGIVQSLLEQVRLAQEKGAELTAVPTKVEPGEATTMRIDWSGHHQSVFTHRALRAACPCAGCVDEMSGQRILKVDQVPLMIRPVEINQVGRYALQIRWSDGHSTGLYAYRYLRTLCECHDCKKVSATASR